MEKALDLELLRLEPKIELENMDITEKVMYLEYITEGQQEKIEQLEQSIDLAEIIEKEGLTLDELSDYSNCENRQQRSSISKYLNSKTQISKKINI